MSHPAKVEVMAALSQHPTAPAGVSQPDRPDGQDAATLRSCVRLRPSEGLTLMSEQAHAASHPPLRRRATLSGLEKLKVSAVLIVKDGELHLDRVLSAVGFCDEILVLDSGSSDRTREICATHNVRR